MNQTPTKYFLKVLQLKANGICNKREKIQLLIENTKVDIITIKVSKLNQSHKMPNISHFTPLRTNHTCKQGGGLLTYTKKNIVNFSHLEVQTFYLLNYKSSKFSFLHHSNYTSQTCTILYIPTKHSSQLLQTEDLIVCGLFTIITNLPNAISQTIKVNLLKTSCLTPITSHKIQTLQHAYHPIKYNNLLYQPSLQPQHAYMIADHPLPHTILPLITTFVIYHKTKTASSHFTKTTKRPIGDHLNSLLRISSPTDPTPQIPMR